MGIGRLPEEAFSEEPFHCGYMDTTESQRILQYQRYTYEDYVQETKKRYSFAKIFISDSQTMTSEAGFLGTPFIRFNDFVGKIASLNELELDYKMGYGIKASEPDSLFEKVKELLKNSNLRDEWQKRRQKMLSDTINLSSYFTWFFENYPESVKTVNKDPDYQLRFR